MSLTLQAFTKATRKRPWVYSRCLRHFSLSVSNTARGVLLRSDNSSQADGTIIPKLWLRDNCRCTSCVNQDTMQRNYNTFKISEDIDARDIQPTNEGVNVIWSDAHHSHYSWQWLMQSINADAPELVVKLSEKRLWGSEIASNPPEVAFDEVMDEAQGGMADLTDKIRAYGFCFLINTPATPEASEDVLKRIGPIRNTHYGAFYDFIPDLALADTAYTNLALDAHTDTTYFTEPAGLQAFHLLGHTPPPNRKPGEVLGGQSLLVDGFNAAQILKRESPEAYKFLRKVNIPWHASGNQGVAVTPNRAYPVVEEIDGILQRVRWNNDDRGVVPLDADVEAWYQSAKKWDGILRRADSEYWFQLQPGRMLIFDNWRILHGRSAFEGLRRICGGYVNRDDFVSRWKTTNYPRHEVIAANLQSR